MIRLSARMEAVAALCEKGSCGADVGCDHAYVSIYLLQHDVFERMLAMDLREGPLKAARENIEREGLKEKIECRLSDGLSAMEAGEADSVICAGMGGELMVRILTDGIEKMKAAKQLILQPQSEVAGVRRFLKRNAYAITAEDMVFEDGKYYPMFRAVPAGEDKTEDDMLYLEYGRQTLEGRHPVLKRFLEHRITTETSVREQLEAAAKDGSEKALKRLEEKDAELKMLTEALSYYKP
ncbi:MAG: SAM-dependent methyltransferase [Lachnospiraceae bacterium]|nr:SAM-dependent methyltransferase [Lachnospiraceae bacterium]